MNKDTKIIKVACWVIGIIAVFIIAGLVGGLEVGTISTSKFIIVQIIAWTTFIFVLISYERMKSIENARERKRRLK